MGGSLLIKIVWKKLRGKKKKELLLGLEPRILCLGGTRLIHWATRASTRGRPGSYNIENVQIRGARERVSELFQGLEKKYSDIKQFSNHGEDRRVAFRRALVLGEEATCDRRPLFELS